MKKKDKNTKNFNKKNNVIHQVIETMMKKEKKKIKIKMKLKIHRNQMKKRENLGDIKNMNKILLIMKKNK